MKDFNFGGKVEHNTEKVTKLDLIGLYRKGKYDAFLKMDTKKQMITIGGTQNQLDCCLMQGEVTYDIKGESKELMDRPISARVGCEYKLNDTTTTRNRIDFKKDIMFESSWI
jgi:hypothetical protein